MQAESPSKVCRGADCSIVAPNCLILDSSFDPSRVVPFLLVTSAQTQESEAQKRWKEREQERKTLNDLFLKERKGGRTDTGD
jgi:hypothetical protein